MKQIIRLISTVLLFVAPLAAVAFDITTHASMTAAAVKQSAITAMPNSSPLFKKLGLYDKDYALGSYYMDIGSLTKRNTTPFERDVMEKVSRANPILVVPTAESIPGWIVRGAVREDDNTKETLPGTLEGDEPNGVFDRVYGHFFDPVNNRGLTVSGLALGPRSPEWATLKDVGVTGFGYGSRQNYYNLPSARESMWRALTLKAWNNGVLSDAVEPTNWQYTSKEELRQAYWATMFRSVGDMVHLLQDAGQPQHTRNDPHSGYGCVVWTSACAGGHASFVESYLKARTLGTTRFRLSEGLGILGFDPKPGDVQEVQAKLLDYCCYTPPTFTKAEDFFSTATGGGNSSGKGLANYSSRGFYSFGTNIGSTLDAPLPSPPPFGEGLTRIALTGDSVIPENRLRNMAGDLLNSSMTFLTGTVVDSISGENATGVKLATVGAWDQFLQTKGILPRYTLNYYNYDDQARLLIPRAVGYSAGLIDYFFRGELEISLPDEGVYAVVDYSKESTKDTGGFNKVKLKLRNKTPRIEPSGGGAGVDQNLETSGTVVAIAKFRRNKCYIENTLQGEIPVKIKEGWTVQRIFDDCRDKVEEIVVSNPVTLPRTLAYSDADPVPLTFDFKDRIPINVMDLVLQVVYRGKLGDETDAVVVGMKDVSEPTFIKISDYRDVFDGGGCKFVTDSYATSFSSAFKIAFNTAASSPFAVEAEVNGTEYSMIAVVSDYGRIKNRAEAVPNKYDPPITLQYNTTASTTSPILNIELDGEAQPAPGTNLGVVIPEYRKSQWTFTDANTLTLYSGVAVEITNVGGMFIDYGLFVDNFDLFNTCTLAQTSIANTKFHSLYPPYSPVVPKALKKVTF